MADLRKHQNILRCQNGYCHHWVEWDGSPYPDPVVKSFPCPECEAGRMTSRCGGRKDDGSPCMKPRGFGGACDLHPLDGSKPVPPVLRPRNPKKPKSRPPGQGSSGPPSPKKAEEMMPANLPPPPQRNGRKVRQVWRESYSAARNDPEAKGGQIHELSLLAAQIDQMNEQAETGESETAWRKLQAQGLHMRKLLESISDATAAKNTAAAQKAHRKLLKYLQESVLPMIANGAGEAATRREIREVIGVRNKVLNSLAKMAAQLNPATLTFAIQGLLRICEKHLFPHVPVGAMVAFRAEVLRKLQFGDGPAIDLPIVVSGNGGPPKEEKVVAEVREARAEGDAAP